MLPLTSALFWELRLGGYWSDGQTFGTMKLFRCFTLCTNSVLAFEPCWPHKTMVPGLPCHTPQPCLRLLDWSKKQIWSLLRISGLFFNTLTDAVSLHSESVKNCISHVVFALVLKCVWAITWFKLWLLVCMKCLGSCMYNYMRYQGPVWIQEVCKYTAG